MRRRTLLLIALSCGLQPTSFITSFAGVRPSHRTLVRVATRARADQARSTMAPSHRTLVRVATANMHKRFGVRTDYYVRLNLIECEGRPSGPRSYSHYLDFGTGSRPSYRCEAAMRDMFASASHSLAVIWWRAGDSNPGPCGYEPLALTY